MIQLWGKSLRLTMIPKAKKKKKKKKWSEESKDKEGIEFKRNEGEMDDQIKKMKKKKKKLSEESKHKEYDEFKSNEANDDHGQLMKKKKRKLIEESKRKEDYGFKSNTVENDDESKKMKKKKLSEDSKHKEDYEFKSNEGENDGQSKKVKKKKKNLSEESKRMEHNEFTSNEGQDDDQGKPVKKKMSEKSKSKENSKEMKKKVKRVTFSDQVEVCCDGLVHGKRFTPEEDEKIKKAVSDYIESHGLGDEGLDMILHCKSHPEVKDCWKEIRAALPDRPRLSVYYRAHILLERDEKRKWTPEELEFVRKAKEQRGSDWKSVAEALGKHRFHVKDAWRRIKLFNTNRGHWSQEEYQNLFDLVNLDLRARALEDCRKSRHGMLRDNISWEAIGAKLATRTSQRCCKKWYEQLTSPMVANGLWSDTDDYRLLNALFNLDACCMEEVDWDNLLEHRPGDVCRKRWNQMIQHIGEHGQKSFAEQVEILAKRFCPDLLEAREAFDNKPVVC